MGSHSPTSKHGDWSISLGNTLLASIVCLLWYVFGLWEEKDKVTEEGVTLTSLRRISITGQATCAAHQGQKGDMRDTSICCRRRAGTFCLSSPSRDKKRPSPQCS